MDRGPLRTHKSNFMKNFQSNGILKFTCGYKSGAEKVSIVAVGGDGCGGDGCGNNGVAVAASVASSD